MRVNFSTNIIKVISVDFVHVTC